MNYYYNAEKYADPTAGKALTGIENEEKSLKGYRPIVFICSPAYEDADACVQAARRYSKHACDEGYIPLSPQLLFSQFLDASVPKEREMCRFFGAALLSKCSELWVFGSRITPEMETEIKRAKWRTRPVRYFTTECEEVK